MQNKFTEAERETCLNMKASGLKAKKAAENTHNKLRKWKNKGMTSRVLAQEEEE